MSRYTLCTSILNRFTGVALSAGLILLVWWLMSVANGARAYARAHDLLSLGFFKLLFAALLFAFCYHFVAGIRHLVWDTGHGMEREQARRSAAVVIGVVLVLTLALVYRAFFATGRVG